jgi:hypothetical protein
VRNLRVPLVVEAGLTVIRLKVDRLYHDQMHLYPNERQQVIDWVANVDFTSQQSKLLALHHRGTGQWFLDSEEFHDWKYGRNKTLFCPGMLGAGKSIIAAMVVDDLLKLVRGDGYTGVAYLYCCSERHQDQNPEDLVAILLKQFLQNQPSLPHDVEALWLRHKNDRTRPSFSELSAALHAAAEMYSQAFIVIDALDE